MSNQGEQNMQDVRLCEDKKSKNLTQKLNSTRLDFEKSTKSIR